MWNRSTAQSAACSWPVGSFYRLSVQLRILVSLMALLFLMHCVVAQQNTSELNAKAAAGDPAAQVQLGMRYALAFPRNIPEAMRWMRKAAEQGYADGQYRLGGLYDVATSPQNPVEAIKWYTLAAKQGHKDAQYRLGVMYDQGRGTAKSPTEAAVWYQRAAVQGRPEAQYRLGEMYEKGTGVPVDYAIAMKWFIAAAQQQRAEAEFQIGYMYEHGMGVDASKSEAIAWYQRSSAHGNPLARDAIRALDQP